MIPFQVQHFLAPQVALHFTPVSRPVSQSQFHICVASRLASLFNLITRFNPRFVCTYPNFVFDCVTTSGVLLSRAFLLDCLIFPSHGWVWLCKPSLCQSRVVGRRRRIFDKMSTFKPMRSMRSMTHALGKIIRSSSTFLFLGVLKDCCA